eukprot:4490074-Prymnesium_polylepis.1
MTTAGHEEITLTTPRRAPSAVCQLGSAGPSTSNEAAEGYFRARRSISCRRRLPRLPAMPALMPGSRAPARAALPLSARWRSDCRCWLATS